MENRSILPLLPVAIVNLKSSDNKQEIIHQLVTIEKKLWKKSDTWGPYIEQEIQRRNTFTFIAHENDTESREKLDKISDQSVKVSGYIIFTCNGLVGHISKVLVVPSRRNQGIGRALVLAAIEFCKSERRIVSLTLHVAVENEIALKLYKNLGFEVEATLEDYYRIGRSAYKMRFGD